ncbi:hypothetical protein [uncultured Sphingomonas sp.]|uniref:hypothetical protein n=1 Tax=uncultured Sphingomonas sp. TaxID=158754 RepID=UPI0025E948AF|nr:hypothetical protein [uncultured Sphingomonas sp.]
MLVGARAKPVREGELVLPAADPVIAATIAGVPVRLRVDLDRRTSVELNPDVAARLPLAWEQDIAIEVGRVSLDGRIAIAPLTVAGRTLPIPVASYDRPCCDGVDGAIGADLLPYARVRWVRRDAPANQAVRSLSLEQSGLFGLSSPVDGLALRFASAQTETTATAAAGATLAHDHGGGWHGPPRTIRAAFGVSRPVRQLDFARPASLAGFRFDHLLVRISDFAGDRRLPDDPAGRDEIVVSHALRRQRPWAAVTLGADRLDLCAEITYVAEPRSLILHCAFDRP